jgi:hypothetical protein
VSGPRLPRVSPRPYAERASLFRRRASTSSTRHRDSLTRMPCWRLASTTWRRTSSLTREEPRGCTCDGPCSSFASSPSLMAILSLCTADMTTPARPSSKWMCGLQRCWSSAVRRTWTFWTPSSRPKASSRRRFLLPPVLKLSHTASSQILEHFGSDSQAKGFGEKPNFKKLESRMASRDRRASGSVSGKGSSLLSKLPPSAGTKPSSGGAPPAKTSKSKK